MEYENRNETQYDKPIRTPKERTTYRLIGELTILSALVFGGVLTNNRDKPDFRPPFVVSECDKSKAHVNYNDKDTWCTPQKVSPE